jgi:hypothetical protein
MTRSEEGQMLDGTVVRGVEGLLARWERSQQLQISRDVFEDLFVLERRLNLELLGLLRRQDDSDANLPATIARALQFDVMEQLFTERKRAEKVLGKLEEDPKIQVAGGVKHVRNIYARGRAIQQIAQLQTEGAALSGVSLTRRLKNLQRDLIALTKVV